MEMERKFSFEKKQKLVDEFLKNNNVYEPKTFENFDMHAYSKYIRDNNLSSEDITFEIMNMFVFHE